MPLRIAAFDNSYARLPARFHAVQAPVRVASPRLVALNRALAAELGLALEGLDDAGVAALFSGQDIPEGAEPLALAYAGHQFGHFVPQLGDGRAVLLGEVIDRFGRRRDIQFKGSGRTPFSRRGDGRAALGPVLREYLLAEAMHALGIPTARALAAVRTGETVLREGPLPGAILTRVAASHVRVGTFEYFAARDDREGLRLLLEHVLARHDPAAAAAPNPALALLEGSIERQAQLIARWMLVGFVHGVMNTDNMTLSGETIDYGPCAFLEHYNPGAVFSGIDRGGRYAFDQQPAVAHWNLSQLAGTLLPLLDEDAEAAIALAREALARFPAAFAGHWLRGMRAKLGMDSEEADDATLIDDWLALLQDGQADFTLAFRRLGDCAADAAADQQLATLFAEPAEPAALPAWLQRWRARLAREGEVRAAWRPAAMQRVNPLVIPRNHLVERVIQAAVQDGDDQPFERLLAAVTQPWQAPADAAFAAPAASHERVTTTWCGT